MNKQELIKHFEDLPYVSVSQMGKKAFIDMIEQLDEPKKATVPQFVAGWMDYCKLTGVDLYHAFEMSDLYLGNYAYQKDYPKLKGYFESENNQETFARAWLDGYEVEKKPKYTVKIKSVNQYLVRNEDENFLGFLQSRLKSKFTRKQLEQAELGWVFDCEGIEIEEVE